MSRVLTLFFALFALATMALAAPTKSGRLEVNGVNYYYEIHEIGSRAIAATAAPGMTKEAATSKAALGTTKQAAGETQLPLLLLHGGLGSIDMFGPVLPALAKTRKVIAVDLHGHGRTALGDRPFKMESMGDDMAAIVKKLGHEQVDVMGYSMGAGVAFRMAVQQPQSVRRLVLVSGGLSDDAFYPALKEQQKQVGAAMVEHMKETPMYQTHYDIFVSPKLVPTALPFLDGKGGSGTWK